MGFGHIIVVLIGIFIAPMILGSYIVAQDADTKALMRWFGLAVLIFIVVPILGALYLLQPF